MNSFSVAKIKYKPNDTKIGLITLFNIKTIKINIENFMQRSIFFDIDAISSDFKLLNSKYIELGFANSVSHFFFTNSIFRKMIYSITLPRTSLDCLITLADSYYIKHLCDVTLNTLCISGLSKDLMPYTNKDLQYFVSNIFNNITANTNIKNIKCMYPRETSKYKDFKCIRKIENNHVKKIIVGNHTIENTQCLNLKYLTCKQITKKIFAPNITHLLCGYVYNKINFNNFSCLRVLSLSHTDLFIPSNKDNIGITIDIPTLTKLYIGYLSSCPRYIHLDIVKNKINKIICNNLEIIKIYNTHINDLSIRSVRQLILESNVINNLCIYSSDKIIINFCEIKTIFIYTHNIVSINQIRCRNITFDKIDDRVLSTNKIDDRVLSTNKIDDRVLSTNKIDDRVLSTNKIDDRVLSTNKIDDRVLSTNKIDDRVLSTNKIDNRVLSTNKINNHVLSTNKIDIDNSVISTIKVISLIYSIFIKKCILNNIILNGGVINECIIDNNNVTNIDIDIAYKVTISNNSTYVNPLKSGMYTNTDINIYTIIKRDCINNNDFLTINIDNVDNCLLKHNFGNLNINGNVVILFTWKCSSLEFRYNPMTTAKPIINVSLIDVVTLDITLFNVNLLTIVFKTLFDSVICIATNSYAIIDDNITSDNTIAEISVYNDSTIKVLELNKYTKLVSLKVSTCPNLKNIYYYDNYYNRYYINIPCLTILNCEKLFQNCQYLDNYQLKKLIIKDNNHIKVINCPNLEVLTLSKCKNICKLTIPNIRRLAIYHNTKLGYINNNKLYELSLINCKGLEYIYNIDTINTMKIIECPNLKK